MAEPIAYVAYDGGCYTPWGNDWRARDEKAHAIVFDDGSVFDMTNGWRHGADPEELARVQKCLDAGYWLVPSKHDIYSGSNLPTITMQVIKEALNPDG